MSRLWVNGETLASSSAATRLTVGLENELPHRASVISVTFLVETPWRYISIKARTKAFAALVASEDLRGDRAPIQAEPEREGADHDPVLYLEGDPDPSKGPA